MNLGSRRPVEDGWYATEYGGYWTERLYTLKAWWQPESTPTGMIMKVVRHPDRWDTIQGCKPLQGVRHE